MKYFPLIWAALWRRPADFFLTLLSVTAAFALFGMMIGFNASVQRIVGGAFPDRINVTSRFGNGAEAPPDLGGGWVLPLAYKDQLLRVPGIARIGYRGGISVYYRDPKNQMVVFMVDEGWCGTLPEFQMTPARCRQLQANRTGIFVSRQIAERFHLKPGDIFPVLTRAVTRADGGKAWRFTVLGVLEDVPSRRTGFGVSNYAYLDESRLLAQRGTVGAFFADVSIPDPAVAAKTALAIEARFANSGDPVFADTDLAEAQARSRANVNIPFVTMVVAGAGLFMVMFLAGNGIYQSVRERIPEFAVLKTLGFSNSAVMMLVFAEAAIPCFLGAMIGLGLAVEFAQKIPALVPGFSLPPPYLPAWLLGVGLLVAVLVAFLSAALPAWRLKRLDIAAALARK